MMAFDSYDLVAPVDYGDLLCLPCARRLIPEDEQGDMEPILDVMEIPYLLRCSEIVECRHISEYGSFGPDAVDTGIVLIQEWLKSDYGPCDYLDIYAERLHWCNLGRRWEGRRNELTVERYLEVREQRLGQSGGFLTVDISTLHHDRSVRLWHAELHARAERARTKAEPKPATVGQINARRFLEELTRAS